MNDQGSWKIIRASVNDIRYSWINILFINFIFVISIQYTCSYISSERNLTASRLPAGLVTSKIDLDCSNCRLHNENDSESW